MSSDVCIEDDIMTIVSCFVVNSGGLSILTPLYILGSVKIINEFKKGSLQVTPEMMHFQVRKKEYFYIYYAEAFK